MRKIKKSRFIPDPLKTNQTPLALPSKLRSVFQPHQLPLRVFLHVVSPRDLKPSAAFSYTTADEPMCLLNLAPLRSPLAHSVSAMECGQVRLLVESIIKLYVKMSSVEGSFARHIHWPSSTLTTTSKRLLHPQPEAECLPRSPVLS